FVGENFTDNCSTHPEPFFTGPHPIVWKSILIVTYTVVFFGGACGVIKMSVFLMKMNTLSVTTTAIVNLVVNHSLFLVTVPFRLYFYATETWIFGSTFCKIVSGMIYFHMYLTFLFYVIILIIRCLVFFQWKDKVEFYRNLHAVAMSIAIWILAFITQVTVILCWYGKLGDYKDNGTCFKFQEELKHEPVKAVNYTLIVLIMITTCTLLGLQVFIISKVMKKLSGSIWSHQEFRAQLKSLFFILIIIFCFLPHHCFRLYYIKNMTNLQEYNEFSLSITTISCLDLFSFAVTGSKAFRQTICSLPCC
uniref:G protein-coupled receptor 141 n=1 Tax=Salvator merianae TaxID=96440 RepID=A0A8D0E064_SALMN